MAETFEELEVWREARVLALRIYKLSGSGRFAKDFGLSGQIQRAAVSVMSNIAEGFARGSNRDFMRFLFISRGSLAEINSQLYIASDLGYITESDFKELGDLTKRLSKRIMTFIKKIDSKRSM